MKIIIHFGMHKTGSTSIQKSFHSKILDERFRFLSINGNPNQSMAIVTLFQNSPIIDYHLHLKNGYNQNDIQNLKKYFHERLINQIENSGGKNLILSGENICRLNSFELRSMKDFFESYKYEIFVCGYIRPPKSFVESAFQQRIKGGINSLSIRKIFPKYKEKFEKFDEVFGKDSVSFWLFDPLNFEKQDVVLDFSKRIGMDYSSKFSLKYNDSLSLSSLKLLYIYRKFGPGYGVGKKAIQENNSLIKRISTLVGEKLHFHSSCFEKIYEEKNEDIMWMEKRLGCKFNENIYKYDDSCIRDQNDLLILSDIETKWLAKELDYKWNKDISLLEISNWIHELRKIVS
jgi:hypothetical protein